MKKNCQNCFYGSFRKCLKGSNGVLLDDREVDQEGLGHDEYDCCSGWQSYSKTIKKYKKNEQ